MRGKNIFNGMLPVLAMVILTVTVSCGKNKASVEGRIAGADKEPVVLEMVSAGNSVWADSVSTDVNGNFRFVPELPAGHTTLYNIKVNGAIIPLFVSQGENITVTSSFGNPSDYSVKGSPESELIREVAGILNDGVRKLDSLYKVSLTTEDEAVRAGIAVAYNGEYRRIKREQIKFIMSHSGSLAAIYALNQRLPGDEHLFDGENDIVYYREVAEHVADNYPDSPYLALLEREIANYDTTMALAGEIALKAENPASFPEIEMPDRYGHMQKLSDRTGKVILLDFWSHEFTEAAIMNAEYRELYEEFADRGLEIFQVSIDNSRPEWIAAVQAQQIPWTTVFDLKTTGPTAARNYNVTKIPANYLIGPDGGIIGRDIFGDNLRKEIAKAIQKVK